MCSFDAGMYKDGEESNRFNDLKYFYQKSDSEEEHLSYIRSCKFDEKNKGDLIAPFELLTQVIEMFCCFELFLLCFNI